MRQPKIQKGFSGNRYLIISINLIISTNTNGIGTCLGGGHRQRVEQHYLDRCTLN